MFLSGFKSKKLIMDNKFIFYIDSFKRLTLKQSLFLVKEKILKKILQINILSLDIIKKNNFLLDAFSSSKNNLH